MYLKILCKYAISIKTSQWIVRWGLMCYIIILKIILSLLMESVFLKDIKDLVYKVEYSKRKTLSMKVCDDYSILVKAPKRTNKKVVEDFIAKNIQWIVETRLKVEERNNKKIYLTEEEVRNLKLKAREIIPKKIEYFSGVMGVKPTAVKINSAKTRWGSCSGKNSVNFSYRIMLLDEELIDYIVVHELAHITVKDHSSRFYSEVAKFMPDYKSRIKKLRVFEVTNIFEELV